jgi:hypothetical protein|tara:strand:- start:955 stop:1194 length:240 start_codon:yes stop_codon:yes gene_type:complete
MGKRKAARLATLQANKEIDGTLRGQLDNLNQMVENLQILLKRETEKNVSLEEKLKELSSKSSAKKPSKKASIKVKKEKE